MKKMEQEELQSEYSDDISGVGKASPALAPMANPDVPRPPICSPSTISPGVLPVPHVETVATPTEATVKREVSSA